MAAPNMNGRLHLTDVHQNSPASFTSSSLQCSHESNKFYFVLFRSIITQLSKDKLKRSISLFFSHNEFLLHFG